MTQNLSIHPCCVSRTSLLTIIIGVIYQHHGKHNIVTSYKWDRLVLSAFYTGIQTTECHNIKNSGWIMYDDVSTQYKVTCYVK